MQLDAKVKKRLIDRCRKEWHWSKEKKQALELSQKDDGYTCKKCDGLFPRKQVQVDHIQPVIDPDYGWQGWDIYLTRLFCPVHSLQILCRACHKEKSISESSRRGLTG